MTSPIVKVEVIPIGIVDENADVLDGTVATVVVRITDSDGRTGIGECDAPPRAVKAFIEMTTSTLRSQNMTRLLIGADPVEVGALWERVCRGTIYPGRRGLGVHALSGIDIALHDLAGKQLGIPVYKLMGGARR